VSEPTVQLTNITKQFDGTRAVDDVTLTINPGVIYGLLGPNGAGKTTTIRMMMRIIYPDSGEVRIFGGPLEEVSKNRIGYLPEERGLYKKMKVLDLLVFFGEIKGLKKADARTRAKTWLEKMNLGDVAAKKAEELSKGMQQKVQFIATVLHEPDLIILDEPFSGLDPVNSNVLVETILEFHRKGHAIIFSTHMMDQVEKLCQEICLIDKGRKILDGRITDIKKSYGHDSVSIRFDGDGSFLKDVAGVASVADHGNEVFLRLADGADTNSILRDVSERVVVRKFEVSEPSIHDIFVEQVG